MILNYPIITNGFDVEADGTKVAKFKRRGDFTILLQGNLDELSNIESELESVLNKTIDIRIHCTQGIL